MVSVGREAAQRVLRARVQTIAPGALETLARIAQEFTLVFDYVLSHESSPVVVRGLAQDSSVGATRARANPVLAR